MNQTNYEQYKRFGSATNFLKNAKPVPFDIEHEEFDLILVTSDGESIFNFDTQNFLKPDIVNGGYKRVTIKDTEGKIFRPYVHKLVAWAFLPNPLDKPKVHHIDRNPINNAIDNLIWVTRKEHAYLHHLWDIGMMDEYWKCVEQFR